MKYLGILALIGVGIWLIFGRGEEWTLIVCDEKLNNAECYSNSYVIPGFETQNQCMLEGASKFKNEGFECGKNCKENEYGLKVCELICNSAGCQQ